MLDELERAYGAADDPQARRNIIVALGLLSRQGVPRAGACLLRIGRRESDEGLLEAVLMQLTDDLAECGYPRCPGDVMATNVRWRQPLAQWRREFTSWLTQPVPDAVLRASVFFDMRPVHGDASLHARLSSHVLATSPTSRLFLAHLAKQATHNEPPVGFFRGFVLEKAGEHRDTLDIKRGGIGAVVELARVHALSIGSPAVNTQSRIAAAREAGVLGADRADDLRDAFEFISYVRLRHQAAQVRRGEPTDNFVAPDALSSFDKRHLREAFGIVRAAQSSLAHMYPMHYIS